MNFRKLETPTIEAPEAYPAHPTLVRVAPPVNLRRIDHQGNRYYYHVTPNGSHNVCSQLYPSSTTIAAHFMGNSDGLNRFYGDHASYLDAQKYVINRAKYGTFLHVATAETLHRIMVEEESSTQLAVSDLHAAFLQYAQAHQLGYEWVAHNWENIVKDLVSFCLFFHEMQVKPLLIEASEINTEAGYAGTCDLLAWVLVGETLQIRQA